MAHQDENGFLILSEEDNNERDLFWYIDGLQDLVAIRQSSANAIFLTHIKAMTGLSFAKIQKIESGDVVSMSFSAAIKLYMDAVIYFAYKRRVAIRRTPKGNLWGLSYKDKLLTNKDIIESWAFQYRDEPWNYLED